MKTDFNIRLLRSGKVLTRSGKTVDIISTSVRLEGMNNEYILAKVPPEDVLLYDEFGKAFMNCKTRGLVDSTDRSWDLMTYEPPKWFLIGLDKNDKTKLIYDGPYMSKEKAELNLRVKSKYSDIISIGGEDPDSEVPSEEFNLSNMIAKTELDHGKE